MSALDTMGAVKDNVAHNAAEVVDHFPAIKVVWGFNPNSKPEHSAGTALDFMVYSDKALGDAIADYLWINRTRLNVRWIIWQQRIRSTSPGKPGTWEPMADRGSPTANHRDHVHVNFWERPYVAPSAGNAGGSSAPIPHPIPVPTKATVSLSHIKVAYLRDAPKPTGHKEGFAPEVLLVERALTLKGFRMLVDGSAGTGTFGNGSAYQKWQQTLGYRGKDADGIPGVASLSTLGRSTGLFNVVA